MTIDKRRLPARAGQLPTFSPVPRQTSRHDGWTEERQRGFIAALADTGSVKAAAHRVNMTPEGAYLLRRHPQGASFRKAWEAALALGVQQLEDVALERALHGTEVPVYSYGKLIGSRIVHNDRLLMFMLRNRAPTRFSADGRATARRAGIGDPLRANELSRLKRQWRKEWEAERAAAAAAQPPAPSRTIEGDWLVQRLELMHRRWFTALSPTARAAYRTFREAEAAGHKCWDEAEDEDENEDAADTDAAAAEADYEEWFTTDRRPKIWRAIDVVFGWALDGGD